MSRYVWCEDSGSGFQFWEAVFSVIDKDIQVQSKNNNSRLRHAVERISDNNQYFVLVDNAMDNADVLREFKKLQSDINSKNNVKLIAIPSFEYVLLSFQHLESWIFAEQDELKEKRKSFLEAKNQFIKMQESRNFSTELEELKKNLSFANSLNSEQIAAKLLVKITKNTGFETTKGKLGKCFVVSCCDWIERQQDDICGLDENRKSSNEKINELIEYTVLKKALQKVDLL